jgi:hypothetical protein
MVLPPDDAPLAAYMPSLLRAARAGDPGAMCRIAFELQRCHELPVLRQNDEDSKESIAAIARTRERADRETEEFLVSVFAMQAERRATLEAVCAGVEPPPDLKPWRLLRDAARSGHVPSMIRFATAFPVNYESALDDLDALAAYRDESEGFLLRAAAAGEPRAAYGLLRAYSGNPALLFRVIREDPVKSVAYAIALQDLLDDKMRQQLSRQQVAMRRKLSKAQLVEAERLGAQLATRYAGAQGLSWDDRSKLSQSAADCAN